MKLTLEFANQETLIPGNVDIGSAFGTDPKTKPLATNRDRCQRYFRNADLF